MDHLFQLIVAFCSGGMVFYLNRKHIDLLFNNKQLKVKPNSKVVKLKLIK